MSDHDGSSERRATDALEVNVIGQRWAWRFEYPESGAVSSDLVLPVDRQVLLRMRSDDVIHSFWVPKFAVKKDAIPGYVNEAWTMSEKTGIFRGQCAELCGKDHAFMPIVVKVVEEAEYKTWNSNTS